MHDILILGGSQFIGLDFYNYIGELGHDVVTANRGYHIRPTITIDRNHPEACSNLRCLKYNIVVDFSGYTLDHVKNSYQYLNFDKYIFISSSAVEALPFQNVGPQDRAMAVYAENKKKCEDFIIQNAKNYTIIRPCFVVGENDYTNRFIKYGEKYYWKEGGEELTYLIESSSLSRVIHDSFEKNDRCIINPCR